MTRPTRRATRLFSGIGVAALAAALGLVAAAPAYASTFTVTSGAQSGAGTLTQAIIDSNASLGADTITITPGLAIDMGTTSTAVTGPITVVGDASDPPTITGPSTAAPIFQVTDGTANIEIDNVKMVGRATGGDALTFVSSSGTVKLIGDTFSNFPHPAVEFLLQTGAITITDSTFTNNESLVADADGGAISAGSVGDVTITGSTFTGNTAGKHGGALEFNAANRVNISGSTFDANSAGTFGGAIGITSLATDSTWTGNTFTGNTSGADTSQIGAGAFYVGSVPTGVTFLVDQSTFSGNTAGAQSASTLGAVGYLNDIGGTVQVTNSTMTGNHFTGVVPGSKTGFGIDLAVGDTQSTGEFDVVQSTFDETGPGSDLVYVNTNLGLVRLASDTLVGPGVLIVSNNNNAAADAVELRDTVAVTTSAAAAIDVSNTPAVISYSVTSDVASLQLVDLGSTQFSVTDPQLGALGNNGGPTSTRLPLTGSPVIDKGDPTFTTPLTDQRGTGFTRILNARVDIGAVESPAATAPTLSETGVNPAPTVWTASTTLAAGALLMGAAMLMRRARRNTAKQAAARR